MLVLGRFLLWLKQDEKTSEYTVISKTVFALSVLVFIPVLTLVHCIKASNREIENVSKSLQSIDSIAHENEILLFDTEHRIGAFGK